MSGYLYVMSGPSGVGKSAIIELVRKRLPDLGYSISHTSRRPRDNEVDGVHYHFVSMAAFRKMIEKGGFVEWAEVYNDFYGTSFASLRSQTDRGVDVLMDLDSQGAKNIKNHFKDVILIYILPPSIKVLEKRLRERGTEDEKVINKRIQRALKELKECVWYHYLVINEDLHRAVKEVESIIVSNRCHVSQMLPRVKKTLGI
jgi:guanylate kinase